MTGWSRRSEVTARFDPTEADAGDVLTIMADGSVAARPPGDASAGVHAVTDSTTLAADDAQKVVTVSKATASTVTVAPDSTVNFPVGTRVDVVQLGAGAVTVAAGAGVTISAPSGALTTTQQYGVIRLTKIAANTWLGTAVSGASAPWLVTIAPMFGDAHVKVGTWGWVHDSSADMAGYYRNSPNAQNDSVAWDIVIGNGTHSFDFLYTKNVNSGIMKVQLDDGAGVFTNLGTIDTYSASLAQNQRASITGVVVTGGTIKRRLRVLIDAKNASSGGYQGFLSGIQVRRTA